MKIIAISIEYTKTDIDRAIKKEKIATILSGLWTNYFGPIRKIDSSEYVYIEPKALAPNLIPVNKNNIKIKGIRKKIIIHIGRKIKLVI